MLNAWLISLAFRLGDNQITSGFQILVRVFSGAGLCYNAPRRPKMNGGSFSFQSNLDPNFSSL